MDEESEIENEEIYIITRQWWIEKMISLPYIYSATSQLFEIIIVFLSFGEPTISLWP